MRCSSLRAWMLVAACSALGACANTGGAANYADASCGMPGAVRESPFNSTANPTEGPLPRMPGDFPCYLPGNSARPASRQQPAIASTEPAGYAGGH